MKIKILSSALEDLYIGRLFYEKQGEGLGEYFFDSLFSDIDKSKEIHQMCQSSKVGCTDCKKYLADSLIKFLEPIQARRGELVKDKNRINKILKQGQEKAQAVAANTLFEVRHLLGM